MKTISEKAYKASPDSPGRGVPYIQWINLGKNTVIAPNDVYLLENQLENGYTFHMKIRGAGKKTLVSNSLPTEYGDLGLIDYKGVKGYPVFYPQSYSSSSINIWKVNLEDIYILDSSGNRVNNYSFVAADAEQTNKFPYGSESNTFVTQNGVWSLYDTIKITKEYQSWPYPGILDLNGLGSNTVQEIAVKEGYNDAPILLCQAATNCEITMISPHQRQAVAVGVMIQDSGIFIEKEPNYQKIINKNNESFFFDLNFTALEFTTGYSEYRVSDTLVPGLSLDLSNTTVTETIAGITTPITPLINIVGNTVNIDIPISDVTSGAHVNIHLAIIISNHLLLATQFTNVASLALINDEPNKNKVAVSKKVTVNTDPKLKVQTCYIYPYYYPCYCNCYSKPCCHCYKVIYKKRNYDIEY
ncbi:CshA/CshB family fibrillar adhesin-related protein [Clostridioides difficile]